MWGAFESVGCLDCLEAQFLSEIVFSNTDSALVREAAAITMDIRLKSNRASILEQTSSLASNTQQYSHTCTIVQVME